VHPFRIHIPEEDLADLGRRLSATRWPDTQLESGWESGVSLDFMRELVDYWRDDYDWRAAERALNLRHHYEVELDGQRLHLIHEASGEASGGFPLLLLHGWPGSFHEFSKLVERLQAVPDAFDLVIPSLPGYGFSGPGRPGMNPRAIATLFGNLMERLGYARYGVQGGDWGASIGTHLALQRPTAVAGLHLNYIPGSYWPPPGGPAPTPQEQAFLREADSWEEAEGGYLGVHATRPRTLGLALDDSPVGLAAWIVDKLRAWSDCEGDVLRRFTRDELLTHVSIYWHTKTGASSLQIYRESRLDPLRLGEGEAVVVPCGVAHFAREAPFPVRSWIERGYDVRRFTTFPRGGHFPAWEEPDLLASDLVEFFSDLR
jgi:pimeloyl-ACP methyl ester carboxylesterase